MPGRRSHRGQSRSLTDNVSADPQVSQSAGHGDAAPPTSQADSAGSVSNAHLALAVVIPVTPATGGAGPHDGERGGRRARSRRRKEEEDEQTPTPGAAPGLRPPRRRSGRKAAGELAMFTCLPPRGRRSAPFRRDCCQRPSMDWMAGACPRDAPELPSTADDCQQQHPLNLKQMRALNPRATHGNTLVMRSSAAPLPVLGPGGPAVRVGLPPEDLG